MNSQLRWKFILILIVVLVCIVSITGFPKSLSQLKTNASSAINLGLDLRGGSHLVLQVSVNEALQQRCDEAIDDLRKQMRTRNVTVGDSGCADATHIVVKNVDGNSLAAFRDLVGTSFPDWTLAAAAGEVNGFELTLKPTVVADLQHNTMEQSIETIQRRVNELGLTEPTVAPTGRGADEILVELPGEGDPARAKAVIQAGGQLQLNLVAGSQTYPSQIAALAANGGVLPPGTMIVPGSSESGAPSDQQVYYILDRAPIVTGQDLRGATPEPSTSYPGQYDVKFTLSTASAARFGPFTESNIGHKMAIVLDNKVYTAPVINGR